MVKQTAEIVGVTDWVVPSIAYVSDDGSYALDSNSLRRVAGRKVDRDRLLAVVVKSRHRRGDVPRIGDLRERVGKIPDRIGLENGGRRIADRRDADDRTRIVKRWEV